MTARTRFNKQDLLLGVSSILEVYPRRQQTARARYQRARARSAASNTDARQLQGDWKGVGEQLKRAIRSYGNDQPGCRS